MRSDNDGEFTSYNFKYLCKESRIKRELRTPYNPQKNGVAERKDRKIMEDVKDMIHDQDMSMHLRVEEARTIVYVQNRTPHRVLENKNPEEVFSGEKEKFIHLIIFGSPIYIHGHKEKRTKLDPSRKKGIFIRYNDT